MKKHKTGQDKTRQDQTRYTTCDGQSMFERTHVTFKARFRFRVRVSVRVKV